MTLDPATLGVAERYRLLTAGVVPRPIALVSSLSPGGAPNLAPFSYFNIVGHSPMALSFSVTGRKPDGTEKDTARNVRPPAEGGTGEFVVNLLPEAAVEGMARAARPLPRGESEFPVAGFTPAPSVRVAPPRIAGALLAFECVTRVIVPFGDARLVIGEVVMVVAADDILAPDGRIDAARYAPVGRLGRDTYCRTLDRFSRRDEAFFPTAPRPGQP